ncbi:MAG: DUF2304 domain-containing protein [Nitrospirota bacterium]
MHDRIAFLAILGSVALLAFIFELVRRRRLKEKYSLVWLLTALALLAVSVIPGLLDTFGKFLGIYYSPTAFFLLAFFFLTLIALQFSVVISKLSERNKILSQEIALLRQRMEELERRRNDNNG